MGDLHGIETSLLFTLLILLSILVGYLWCLALSRLASGATAPAASPEPALKFAFVVPAHNEELGIGRTVASLLAVAYPRALFQVVVVADNCTDATAQKARLAGGRCLERHDAELRGKGYALAFAFGILLQEGFDAFVVVDADSVVSENFLCAAQARLYAGERAIQALYGISNPDASIMTYLFQVGNLIENLLFWEPKERLGLPIFLRGNGMVFGCEVLLDHPWEAFSITEDTEYGLMLVERGVRVSFAVEMGVYASQPETVQQAFAQRVRWAAGNSTLTKARAVRLIATGLFERDLDGLDCGLTLIAGSRPLLLLANLVLLGAAAFLGSPGFGTWALALFAAQLGYLGLGIFLNGFSCRKLVRLFLSPFYLLWLCGVSLLGVAGYRRNQWVRTSRT